MAFRLWSAGVSIGFELKFEKLLSKSVLYISLFTTFRERDILRLSKGLADGATASKGKQASGDGHLHSARCCVMQEVFQTLQVPQHSEFVAVLFVINEGVKKSDSFAEGRGVDRRVLRVGDGDLADVFDIKVRN